MAAARVGPQPSPPSRTVRGGLQIAGKCRVPADPAAPQGRPRHAQVGAGGGSAIQMERACIPSPAPGAEHRHPLRAGRDPAVRHHQARSPRLARKPRRRRRSTEAAAAPAPARAVILVHTTRPPAPRPKSPPVRRPPSHRPHESTSDAHPPVPARSACESSSHASPLHYATSPQASQSQPPHPSPPSAPPLPSPASSPRIPRSRRLACGAPQAPPAGAAAQAA